jgi:CelD/BcsL family acetyltransferase involved in cellulose biosynthesis
MIPMLAEDEALRVSYVTLDGVDIAYCFGGVLGDLYRGLQLSYHDDYGDLSPGNLAQWVMLEGLADEGIATYDMGQSMDYKERWSDREETSVALIIR